jgi:hypothetical protein
MAKLEKHEIAHEIYRKSKKGLHASSLSVHARMRFSTKKIDPFFPIGRLFFRKNASKF